MPLHFNSGADLSITFLDLLASEAVKGQGQVEWAGVAQGISFVSAIQKVQLVQLEIR